MKDVIGDDVAKMTKGVESMADAVTAFAIAVVDLFTPAIEELARAMWSLIQWGEIERIISGEQAAFGFRAVEGGIG
jgi:hypothetical protein